MEVKGCRIPDPWVSPAIFEYFTADELELFALPIASESAASASKTKMWLEETAGVNGQPLALIANRLDPAERLGDVLEGILSRF